MFRKRARRLSKDDAKPPALDGQLKAWCLKHRTRVEGKVRKFLVPQWSAIYEDTSDWKMIVAGRQVFKSTYFCDALAHSATTNPGSTSAYVTFEDPSLATFADKLRKGTFSDNPRLLQHVIGSTIGSANRIAFKNRSLIYLQTGVGKFRHVEGKSPNLLILDEAQYLPLEHFAKLRESMATTQGRLMIGGVGGEQGSQYHMQWQTTDQRKWIFKKEDWRSGLEFGNEGLKVDEYLLDQLAGEWVPRMPENSRRGYWLPQTHFAHIPLTINDAKEKYRVNPEYSIEHKLGNYARTDYMRDVMGQFYEGIKRPLTPAMVLACMRPYSYLSLMTGPEVVELKATHGRNVVVSLGVDFGSGRTGASKTVAAILVKWVARPDQKFNTPRYLLAEISDDAPIDDDEKALWLANMIRGYGVDSAVGDLGYGEHIIRKVQKGGFTSSGEPWKGVGERYLKGCRTTQNPVGVILDKKSVIDEEGRRPPFILIDKTHTIQNFVDFIKRHLVHPYYADTEWAPGEFHTNNSILRWARSQLIIPYAMPRKVDWLSGEFTGIERKDLDDNDTRKPDRRQSTRLEFNHPPDAVMAIAYALVASEKFDPDAYRIIPVNRRFY